MADQPAGWQPDPTGRHELRYWDGSKWTDDVSSRGLQGKDDLSTAPPAVAPTATLPTVTSEKTRSKLPLVIGGIGAALVLLTVGAALGGGGSKPTTAVAAQASSSQDTTSTSAAPEEIAPAPTAALPVETTRKPVIVDAPATTAAPRPTSPPTTAAPVTAATIAAPATTSPRPTTTTVPCPTGNVTTAITKVQVVKDNGGGYYDMRVEGTVTNNRSAAVVADYVEYAYLRGGAQVDDGTVFTNKALQPGETLSWVETDFIKSDGGAPDSAQANKVEYHWQDPNISSYRCPAG